MRNMMSFLSQRPRPGRRRAGMAGACMRFLPIAVILMSIISCVSAHDMDFHEREYQSEHFKRLARRGQIHVDRSDPPPLPQAALHRRQNSSTNTTSQSPSSTVTPTTSTQNNGSGVVITTPIPSPFDTSLGSNFTSQSCPDFFANFLANNTFKSCIPISLLLQNSNSFFQAERSPNLLGQTLAAACNAPMTICSPLMTSLASQLIDEANCKDDYDRQNPLVRQAYNGMMAYEPIYRATCLKSTNTAGTTAQEDSATSVSGEYCFSLAISNGSNPADAYPYYTALGIPLPATSQPTCSQCLKETMNIFASYAEESTSPLSQTYLGCATTVDTGCGNSFANTSIKVAQTNVAASRQASGVGVALVPMVLIATFLSAAI